MAAFWVVNRQSQKYIDSLFSLDYDSQMTEEYFAKYIGIEVKQFRDKLIQHIKNVKKSVAERRHIRPVNDQVPFAEVQLTAQHNVLANEQQHTEQSEPIYDTYLLEKVDSNTTPDSTNMSHRGGEIDQDAEQYQVKSPLLNAELFKTKEMIEKETYNELSHRFLLLEKHCISLELEIQQKDASFQSNKPGKNQDAPEFREFFEINDLKAQLQAKTTLICNLKNQIKSVKEASNEAKVKNDIDVIETINIELEHSVAKLLAANEQLHKENEHLKQTYKELYDSIKKTRVQNKDNSDSLISQINQKSVENADLKAQIQEKVFANAALKNELRKLKGNIVDSKFAKASILGKPPLQPSRNHLVVRQPNAFTSERPRMSRPRFASQVDEKNDLSKTVTPHYLPKVRESAAAKPHQVNAPNYSRNSHKESYGSNDMVHAYFLEDARKMTQDKTRIPNHRDMASTRAHCTPNACTPKPRNIYRSSPVSKCSGGMSNGEPLVDHSRNSSFFLDSKQFVCSICHKYIFNTNHDDCITKILNKVNSRAKVQSLKIRNNNPVEPKNHTHKPGRQIGIGQRFSLNKSSAVHEKPHTPRSCLRWKPTGRIFKTVSLRWIPTGKMFTDSTTKIDSKLPNGSNDDITNLYECNQTLYFSAGTSNSSAGTSVNPVKERLRVYDSNVEYLRANLDIKGMSNSRRTSLSNIDYMLYPSLLRTVTDWKGKPSLRSTERSLLHDNIVPKPDLALELGKSISLTEAEEEAVAREVHATHARIVSESEPEPTQRRQSGIAFRDSFIVSKKRSSDSSKKLKGIQTLTPAEQEVADIMKALKESKKMSKRQPGTRGSNEGTGNILGVPDESIVVSRASSEGTGSKPGVPDEEKLILEWEADVDSEHFDRDDNAGDDNEETKPDPEEIYKTFAFVDAPGYISSDYGQISVSPTPYVLPSKKDYEILAVDPVGSPSSTTIDQDEQSTSTSPTNQEIQSQVTHQGPVPQFMAPVRISSGPEPIMMTPGQLISGLAPSPVPATTYIPPTDKDLEILFQPMFNEYFDQSTDGEPVPTATVVNAPIVSTNTSVSTTIAQDAPSTSHSLSSSQVHPPVFPQGVAARPTIEDTSITQADLHPSVNPVAGEPSSAQSTLGDVSLAEPNQVTQPPDHLRRWTKDHPLDNIVGNPSRPVSTRKQLASDAFVVLFHTELRSLLHDNIVPKPDLALELGKSISLTEAEEEAVAREVHATHARIVSESEPEPTQRRQSGIAFRDSFIVSKKRSSDSSKKLKGIQTLTPAEQEAADIMKALKESKKMSKRQPGTGGSNEGTGNILGVPDESTVISRASSEGTGSKPGVPDEEKLIL
ncbi:hypothetical protein Tco_0162423 [Tanacetum coccineum]